MAIKTNGFVKGRLPEELKKLIKSVASEYGDVIDLEHLEIVPLKGAMTNEVYQITWPTKDDDFPRKVLVRVYGEGVEVFFNREDEIRTFETISKHGQGPRLLGRFGAGRIEEFIHARVCEKNAILIMFILLAIISFSVHIIDISSLLHYFQYTFSELYENSVMFILLEIISFSVHIIDIFSLLHYFQYAFS